MKRYERVVAICLLCLAIVAWVPMILIGHSKGVRDTEARWQASFEKRVTAECELYYHRGVIDGHSQGWLEWAEKYAVRDSTKTQVWQPPKDLHDLIGERMETVDGCAVLVCGADNKSQMVYFTKPCGGHETSGIKAKYLRPTTGGR